MAVPGDVPEPVDEPVDEAAGGDDPGWAAFAAEVRADDAIASRAREASLRRQARDELDLAGVLADAAGRSAVVTVTMEGGHVVRGAVADTAADHVVVRGADGLAWVALTAVQLVEGLAGLGLALGGTEATVERSLAAALTDLVDLGASAQLDLRSGASVWGRPLPAGSDVVVVASDGGGLVAVPLAALAVVRATDG